MEQPQPPMPPNPYWMPQFIVPQDNSPVFGNSVPARVKLAADWAIAMAQRSFPIIAVSGVGVTVETPPPLTKGEESSWDAACTLLHDYFSATGDIDGWEQIREKALEIELMRRNVGKIHACPCRMKTGVADQGSSV